MFTWLDALFSVSLAMGCVAWWGLSWCVNRCWQTIPALCDQTLEPRTHWPRLSVVVPARDEAVTLREAMRSLQASTYPNLELILVNDRSTDATGAMMEELAAADERIRVQHVTALPAGWLGKVHALEVGRQQASGEWLVFTDADVHFAPDALSKAVCWAERQERDFVSVIPEVLAPSALHRSVYTFLLSGFFLGTRAWQVNADQSFVGAGAFGMVRRELLERSPGFAWLRLEVLDDIGLAQTMFQEGARCGVLWGRPAISLEWYPSILKLLQGLEKNLFAAACQYRYERAVGVIVLTLWIGIAPWLALASGGGWGVLGLSALVSYGWSWRKGDLVQRATWRERALSLLLFPMFPLALGLSVRACWRHDGVVWRGTRYALSSLRRGRRLQLW
jgi:glycosyltransferase involved in cell wall biosynthesis